MGHRATSRCCSARCCSCSPRCWRAEARWTWVALAGVVGIWLASGPAPAKSNVRTVAGTVAPALRPGDLVVCTQPEQVPVLSRYLPPGLRFLTPLGTVARAAGDRLARRRRSGCAPGTPAGAGAAVEPARARPPGAVRHAGLRAAVAGAVEPRGPQPNARVARVAAGASAAALARQCAALDLAAPAQRRADAALRRCARTQRRDHRLLLVRHGESTWNAEHRLQGQADPPLSELGREQAARSRRSSTGSPTAASPPTSPARSRPPSCSGSAARRPTSAGARSTWATGRATRSTSSIPESVAAWRRGEHYPAESVAQFQARVAAAVDELRGEDAIVVTHGGCIRAATAHLTGADARTPRAARQRQPDRDRDTATACGCTPTGCARRARRRPALA